MKGTMVKHRYKDGYVEVYLPPSYQKERAYPCVIIQDGDVFLKMAEEVLTSIEDRWSGGDGEETVLVFMTSKDRLLEYTPWKEKALNAKFHDFGGGGERYLQSLENEFLPWIQGIYRINGEKQGIFGYSLSGLIAVYAMTRKRETLLFSKIGSLCSSFWYPNWIEYLKQNVPTGGRFYFHYGTQEGMGKKERLSKAPDYAKKTIQIIEENGRNEVVVTYDNGGHHDFMKERFYKMLVWFSQWEH